MKTTRKGQAGLTMFGLIFILAFIGILVLFVVRAFPLYNEKMQVVSAMNAVLARPEAASMSEGDLARTFLKNLSATANLPRFNTKNIKEMLEVVKPENKGDPKQFRVHYQATSELFKDLKLMLDVDHRIPIQGNASGTGE